ncbi:hypothetical protein PUR49_08000 [Streptomyces sp. BE147]|uniref:hypothetical protein n=1 Tax=Streptomyces sp. BE147 TaxID=3002524 RepID=UPI002E77FB1F|nr:hypothetical protein [Streptomyces sp. BE147]MEE1736441.1 hypothetical protein [Streptomyces sp. BE147]
MTATVLTHLQRTLAESLAGAARRAGHLAQTNISLLEGSRTAHVLVTAPGGRRTVLQVSPLAARGEWIRAQTARLNQHDLDIVWFTTDTQDPPWLAKVPAVRVTAPVHPGGPWTAPAAVQQLKAEACTCGPAWRHGEHRTWAPPEPVTLPVLLDDLLARRLLHATTQTELPGRRFTSWAWGRDVRAEAEHLRGLAANAGALTDAAGTSIPSIPRRHLDGRLAVPLGRLLEAARLWGHQNTGVVCHIETATADWMAGGLVVTPSSRPTGRTVPAVTALVRPLPHKIAWNSPLSAVPVLVGSPEEYFTLRHTAPKNAQILIL